MKKKHLFDRKNTFYWLNIIRSYGSLTRYINVRNNVWNELKFRL